jgi:hypothetical protein
MVKELRKVYNIHIRKSYCAMKCEKFWYRQQHGCHSQTFSWFFESNWIQKNTNEMIPLIFKFWNVSLKSYQWLWIGVKWLQRNMKEFSGKVAIDNKMYENVCQKSMICILKRSGLHCIYFLKICITLNLFNKEIDHTVEPEFSCIIFLLTLHTTKHCRQFFLDIFSFLNDFF